MMIPKIADTICPSTVATAAPATPQPKPKGMVMAPPNKGVPVSRIKNGSSTILMIAPSPCVYIESMVLPEDCISFSIMSCAHEPNEQIRQMDK